LRFSNIIVLLGQTLATYMCVKGTVREGSQVMEPKYIVYEDEVIAVGLRAENGEADERDLLELALKWLPPQPCRKKDGTIVQTTNMMGGETDWFLLPHTLGAAIGMKLVELRAGGLSGFKDDGFNRMLKWLVEMEHLQDAMCY
jgi:hypothetical protein